MNNYSYDALHRITAMHNSLIRPGLAADNAYSTSYSYDPAGNIQRLSRRGFVGMSGNAPVYDLIDDLHYSYAPGANPVLNAFSSKLQGVDDMVTNTAAQPHGVFLPSSGYGYDDNGNMISAGSISAEYNILNLPTMLSTSSGDRKFEYVYGAGKYSAELITGNPAIDETRHYLGGMEFKNGILEAYNFGDGRVVWENGVPKFQYRLHDHLGNTVVFFEDKNNNGCITTEEEATGPADLEIVQRLLYYPFGMALEGLGAWNAQPWQQYRYNGKERDTLTGWYEYGFRWYIDGIGRFTGVDPIADRFAWVSVYNYAENRPVDGIDLHGLQYLSFNDVPKIGDPLLTLKHRSVGLGYPIVNYKGENYYNIGHHINKRLGERITKWLYLNINPVIDSEDYVGYGETYDCFKAVEKQVNKLGLTISPYYESGVQMSSDTKQGLKVSESSKIRGIDLINSSLEAGNPIVVGVNYASGSPGNLDGTTDHFITIVGRGNDKNGEYFTFYENAVDDKESGTDISTNKLYLQKDNTLRGKSSWYNTKFTVTMVRPTKKTE